MVSETDPPPPTGPAQRDPPGPDQAPPVTAPEISVECAGRVNFASAQNSVPILRALRVSNPSDQDIENLTLDLSADPAFLSPRSWTVDRIDAGGHVDIGDRALSLDHTRLGGLNEAEHGSVIITLSRDGETLAVQRSPVELLARDQWGGTPEMAQLLAAFVAPNDPAIAALMKEAGRILEGGGHAPALDGYQSADPRRTYMLAAAAWSAVTALGLTYAEPPKSFERAGQKIRPPDRIHAEGLATCLDTTLLMASLLEAIGLNPAAIFVEGHAFAGVWLVDRTFASVTEPDITEIRKAIAAREFVAFETTLLTARPAASFDRAIADARKHLSEEAETEFDRAVDIARARSAGIRPLASHRAPDEAEPEGTTVAAVPLPPIPDFGLLPGELIEEVPTTAEGRIGRWQRKLLDLSLRNRLLNFSDTKSSIPFHCPDVPLLEDRLADGRSMRVISLDEENPVGERDPDLYLRETGQHIHDAFTAQALDRGEVCVPLPDREMRARLTTLYRKARSDLAEGGTNTLFLAAGFLRWKKTPEDRRTYRAPLLLLPVKLTRRSAQSDFRLTHHEDEVRMNATLLQFMERDFGVRVPALEGALPTDSSGLDLPRIFGTMRAAIRDVPGFEVSEDVALSTFSFAKYLMWKDLVDRTDRLRENRLVHHLIDHPDLAYPRDGTIPAARDIDRTYKPSDLATPLPADSSQLAAVAAVAGGHDLVIIGPPGTGKSQTIANMIAHALFQGRSVLFVAEKSAALDVVHRRLKAYGLGDASLELHSNKADRRSVLAQLGAAWDRATDATDKEWIDVTDKVRIHRDDLNAYVDALHAPGSHGHSIFQGIGIAATGDPAPLRLSFSGPEAHDPATFRAMAEAVEDIARTHRIVAGVDGLASVARTEWSHGWQNDLLGAAAGLSEAAASLSAAATSFEASLGANAPADPPLHRIEVLTDLARAIGGIAAGDFTVAASDQFETLKPKLGELGRSITKLRETEARFSARYDRDAIARMPLDQIDADWRAANTKFWPLSYFAKGKVRKLLQSYAAGGEAAPETDINALLAAKAELDRISATPLTALAKFDGVDTDTSALSHHLETAARFRTALSDFRTLATDAAALAERIDPLLAAGGDTDPAVASAKALIDARTAYGAALSQYRGIAGADPLADTPAKTIQEMTGVQQARARLPDWTLWVAAREKAEPLGLAPVITALQTGDLPHNAAPAAFQRAYMDWWLPLAMDAKPPLRRFTHWDHQDRIKRFRELDDTAQRLAAEQVIRAVAHDLPARDETPKKSELGTLKHQLSLKRPSKSIRDLIGEMPTAFTQLAPCVLMSPLSIAQYLPAGHAQFDLVIFDEASQITTWDAIGAIARGGQSVIVGDPKQLPPTNFFGRSMEDDDEDLADYERDLPSILDEVHAAGLPSSRLDWHYRSRDETLIAFSNHHYYDDGLVTFPSPDTGDSAVVFHNTQGVYARGAGRTNEIEAKAIVAMIVERLNAALTQPEDSRETIGVITFNTQQQELILDLLDAERRKAPALEWFFDEAREEPLIVKNLESIQGDERDVMCFSITFGKDAAGKMSMSFGAVNNSGGERRLNVAVTRARSQLHVFSSITADMIDLNRTGALGVRHLKAFLDYAERGPVALPEPEEVAPAQTASRFEDAVAQALRARGWQVDTRVGVSGMRVDLGIRHPDREETYLAGIECDGATYHRTGNARDRDKIRDIVLGSLGWNLMRVWSTDWFRAPGETCDRIDEALQALLAAARETDAREAEERAAEAVKAAAEEATAEATNEDSPADATPPDDPEPGSKTIPTAKDTPSEPDAGSEPEKASVPPEPDGGDDQPPIPAVDGPDDTPDLTADPTSDPNADPAADTPAAPAPQMGPDDPPGDKQDLPALDPDRFHELDYVPTLKALIAQIVADQSPIREDLLIRTIAKHHGWSRAGRRIRERINACLDGVDILTEGDNRFVWQAGTYAPATAFRGMGDRSPRDISRTEIVGLIQSNPNLSASIDPVKDLSTLMGLSRLTEDTRAYLTTCWDIATKQG